MKGKLPYARCIAMGKEDMSVCIIVCISQLKATSAAVRGEENGVSEAIPGQEGNFLGEG